MNLTLNTREAAQAFATLAAIVPNKTTKPVLQTIHVDPGTDVQLTASSLDVTATVTIPGRSDDSPAFLVPAKEISALLKEIDDDEVRLEAEDYRQSPDSRVKLQTGSGSFQLVGPNPDEFPDVDMEVGAATCTLPGPDLAHAIESAAFAVAKEETRYAINGALFEVKGDTLTIVGTDGRRLSICEVECNGMADARAVVPSGVLKTIAKAAGSAESVGISIDGGRAVFTMGAMVLGAQCLEDRFPVWESVIPTESGMQLTFDREPLQHALARVSTICRGDVPIVRFSAEESTVRLSTESASVGRADETLELECVAEEPMAISVNPDYLTDALKVAQADQIPVSLKDEATPMVWSLGGGVRYVLMPISGS